MRRRNIILSIRIEGEMKELVKFAGIGTLLLGAAGLVFAEPRISWS